MVSVSAALGLFFAAAVRPLPAPERAFAGFSVLGAEACVVSPAAVLPVLADCAVPSSALAVALGLRAPVPRDVERPVVVLAELLAVGVAAVAVSAVAAAPGAAAASDVAEEISLDAAAVFLLLVATVLVVLPALRLEALAAAVVLEAEVLGEAAGGGVSCDS